VSSIRRGPSFGRTEHEADGPESVSCLIDESQHEEQTVRRGDARVRGVRLIVDRRRSSARVSVAFGARSTDVVYRSITPSVSRRMTGRIGRRAGRNANAPRAEMSRTMTESFGRDAGRHLWGVAVAERTWELDLWGPPRTVSCGAAVGSCPPRVRQQRLGCG